MQAKEEEEEGRSEMDECTEILHTASSETLETSVIFHFVKEIIGFVLHMHQQIPAILRDITLEYDTMRTEYKDLGSILSEPEVKSSCRRKHSGRMREVKQGIKKLDKLMNSFCSIQTALQSILNETHDIERVILVLGPSPIRPQHVYEIHFLHGRVVTDNEKDYVKSRAADTLSRKVIRALISNGAGSVSYAGPTELFLLVKAPATLNSMMLLQSDDVALLDDAETKAYVKLQAVTHGSTFFKDFSASMVKMSKIKVLTELQGRMVKSENGVPLSTNS